MYKSHRHLLLLFCTQVIATTHTMEQSSKQVIKIPGQSVLKSTKKEIAPVSNTQSFDTTGTPRELAARIATLSLAAQIAQKGMASVTAENDSLVMTLTPLNKAFALLHKQSTEITAALEVEGKTRTSLMNAERIIKFQESKIDALSTVIALKVRREFSPEINELLKGMPLPIEKHLSEEKRKLVEQSKLSVASTNALSTKLNPILKQQEELNAQIDPLNKKLMTVVEQKKAHQTQEDLAIAEKTCLEAALRNQHSSLQSQKTVLEDTLKALELSIEEEKDVDAKIKLRTRRITLEREITTTCERIQEIETLTQLPPKSTGFFGWFSK